MKSTLIALIVGIFPFLAYAQINFHTDTLQVEVFGQDRGISQLNILDMDIDERGYLWVGTEDGINRFNGYEFKIFSHDPNVPGGIPDDHIRGLLFADNKLWMASNTKSVFNYDIISAKTTTFSDLLPLKQVQGLNFASSIFALNDQTLLVSTHENAIIIDLLTKKLSHIALPINKANDYILSLVKLNNDEFLLGTFFSGLLKLDLKQQRVTPFPGSPLKAKVPIYALAKFSTTLYISAGNSFYAYHANDKKLLHILSVAEDQTIRCFVKYKDLLFIGSSDGLFIYDEKTKKSKPLPIIALDGKEQEKIFISTLMTDGTENLWIGTQGKGLFLYNPFREKFETRRIKLPEPYRKDFISLFNFLKDRNNLWLATDLGLVRFDQQGYQLYPPHQMVYTIKKDQHGTLWAGGFGMNLRYYDKVDDKLVLWKDKDGAVLPDDEVIEIIPLVDSKLWVATWSLGIFEIDLNQNSFKPVKINGKVLKRVRISYKDKKNNLWLGADNGLFKISENKVIQFRNQPNNPNSLINDRVFAIQEDSTGAIWVGTASGLSQMDPATETFTSYTKQSGLPNDFIYGILIDDNNQVWVSTNYGLSVFNQKTRKFRNFTEADGLQNNEFNGKAAYKDSNGSLYFGGMNGFNVIDPNRIPLNPYIGKTNIEEVELFGQKININLDQTDTLTFNHNQNVLTFKYTTISYLQHEKSRYQFKMDGFDPEWRNVTPERSTTYTNLNPGTYTFMVRGSNNEQFWNKKPTTLTVIIYPPWYKSWWFKSLLTFIIIIALISIYIFRSYKFKKKTAQLERLVQERTKEISEKTNDLEEAYRISEDQKENITFLMKELNHRVKNNLQLIASILNLQGESIDNPELKEKLQSSRNRIYTMAQIHNLLAQDQVEKSNVALDIFIQQLIPSLLRFLDSDANLTLDLSPVDVSSKHIAPIGLILNELVTNSVKHAFPKIKEEASISIHLSYTKEDLILTYADNGPGIEDTWESNESLGMMLIKTLVEQIGGVMDIKFRNKLLVKIVTKRYKCVS